LATLSIAVMGALWLQVFSCLDLRDGLIGPVRESRSASVASQSPRETHGVDVSLSVGSPRGKWLRVVADGALGRTDGRIYAETGTSTMVRDLVDGVAVFGPLKSWGVRLSSPGRLIYSWRARAVLWPDETRVVTLAASGTTTVAVVLVDQASQVSGEVVCGANLPQWVVVFEAGSAGEVPAKRRPVVSGRFSSSYLGGDRPAVVRVGEPGCAACTLCEVGGSCVVRGGIPAVVRVLAAREATVVVRSADPVLDACLRQSVQATVPTSTRGRSLEVPAGAYVFESIEADVVRRASVTVDWGAAIEIDFGTEEIVSSSSYVYLQNLAETERFIYVERGAEYLRDVLLGPREAKMVGPLPPGRLHLSELDCGWSQTVDMRPGDTMSLEVPVAPSRTALPWGGISVSLASSGGGLVVESVSPMGLYGLMGVRVGDTIRRVNGRVPIAEAELACVAEGSSLELELDRVSLSWQWPRDGDTLLDSARRQ
jgi:hypothetical protein